jgi:hypothetical protein
MNEVSAQPFRYSLFSLKFEFCSVLGFQLQNGAYEFRFVVFFCSFNWVYEIELRPAIFFLTSCGFTMLLRFYQLG